VPNLLVQKAHNNLAASFDFLSGTVNVSDPVKGLLRRCDIVAHEAKTTDR